MRYLLTLLLLIGISYGQKTKIYYINDDSCDVYLKGCVDVEHNKIIYEFKSGELVKEFEIDFNDEKVLDKIKEKLEKYDIEDGIIKEKIVDNINN